MSEEAKTKVEGKWEEETVTFKLLKEGMKHILWSLWLINMQMKNSASQSRRVKHHIKRKAEKPLLICSDWRSILWSNIPYFTHNRGRLIFPKI